MKIAIITGSYPPDVCGVSDYTERLEQNLRLNGVDVDIYTGRDWRLRSSLKNSIELATMGVDILHLQYPATGYGWKLGPQAMAIAQPMLLTMHEASQSHLLRRLSLYPFSIWARQIIFTNEFEMAYAQQFAPWIKGHSHLIPIGNNVQVTGRSGDRPNDNITYFGLIRPEKGLEEVMEVARLLKAKSHSRAVRIIGMLMPGHEAYYKRLRAEGANLNLEWHVGLRGEALSVALAESDIAYLPFPDGASERRSSLITLLVNGTTVITTHGSHTPSRMRDAVLFANSPSEVLRLVDALVREPARKSLLQQNARVYAEKFAWDNIAAKHISIYEEVLRRARFRSERSRTMRFYRSKRSDRL